MFTPFFDGCTKTGDLDLSGTCRAMDSPRRSAPVAGPIRHLVRLAHRDRRMHVFHSRKGPNMTAHPNRPVPDTAQKSTGRSTDAEQVSLFCGDLSSLPVGIRRKASAKGHRLHTGSVATADVASPRGRSAAWWVSAKQCSPGGSRLVVAGGTTIMPITRLLSWLDAIHSDRSTRQSLCTFGKPVGTRSKQLRASAWSVASPYKASQQILKGPTRQRWRCGATPSATPRAPLHAS